VASEGPGAVEPPSPSARAAEPDDASAQSSTSSRKFDLGATGFHKALPPGGRLARLWAAIGLLLGRRLAMVIRDDHIVVIVMAAFVGITSGAAAGLLLTWIEFAIDSFPRPAGGIDAVRLAVVIAVPVLGGLLAGLLRVFAARFIREPLANGVPAVVEAIATRGGVLSGRAGLLCGIGTGVTIASGGSVGHEGPSVAIGAAVGSVVARFFGLGRRRRIAMVGAGCAGGLAAAFNAPLAGVIFTVEIVFGGAIGGDVGTMSVFIPLIVAAVCGTFTSYSIRGDDLAFDLVSHTGTSAADLLFFVLLACAAGAIGTVFSKAIQASSRRFEAWRAPAWVKPAAGALGVGVLAALVSNELLGAGHSTVERALHGQLAWQLALALLVLKIVATSLTLGSGGFGGALLPSLYVGACLGTLVGTGVNSFMVGADVGAYALCGMGAVFAATMHAPLTPIVMMFELTHDYGVILPLMLSCILATVVARRLGPNSLFKAELLHRGVVLDGDLEGEVMKRGLVRELMLPPTPVLTLAAGLDEIRAHALAAELRAVFVVDADGAVIGYLNGTLLAKHILSAEVKSESTAGDLMTSRKMPLLHDTDTLAGAMLASARSGMELLPVVDEHRRLIGVLRRGDLIGHYSDKVLGEREEVVQVRTGGGGPVDQEVGLGKGLVLERVVIGRAWAGRSLAELDLRGRTAVTVLEWVRGEITLPVDPRAPLREGDVLALAGTREQILRTRALSVVGAH
jgi:chloride channel protein, CIC family